MEDILWTTQMDEEENKLNQMKRSLNEMEGQIHAIKNNWNELKEEVNASGAYWKGAAGERYRNFLRESEEELEGSFIQLEGHRAAFLDKLKHSLDVEKETAEIARNLRNI